jgi:hypothetical protein
MQEQQKNQDAAIGLNSLRQGSLLVQQQEIQYWNGTVWVVVAATVNETATLQMGGVPTWTGGTHTTARGLVMNIKEEKYFIFQAEDTGYVEGETHGLIAAHSTHQPPTHEHL